MDNFRSVKAKAVEVSLFAYATEDESKVIDAALNVVGREFVDSSPKIEKLTGHYNDPILSITFNVTGNIEEMLKKLFKRLSTVSANRLVEEARERIDSAGNLYLRLDKQKAYQGTLVFNESDPIRIKIRFTVPHLVDPVRSISVYLLSFLDDEEKLKEA
ncbi:hypothetical protein KEJ21_01840 [Candidatus Bathyarchaeota archaeon]|nr:hypothetical protein [Candidatus Bathyarchaeota archaeon]MBS7630609.1 hypothetical protein [Candidatus Bathyarchaeota archaeon]